MNRHDENLCAQVSELWREEGGDAEGFLYCWRRIFEMLRVVEDEG